MKIIKTPGDGMAIVVFLTCIFLGGVTALLMFCYNLLNKPAEFLSPLPYNIKLQEDNYVRNKRFVPQQTGTTKLHKADKQGQASYYNRTICKIHGSRYGIDCLTASGELFDDTIPSAACPRRLLGKSLLVQHEESSVKVKCNDTGSFTERYGRVLDLSQAAFAKLAPLSQGVITVTYKEI